jgi:hypothetical protein
MKRLFYEVVLPLVSIHLNLNPFAEWFEFKSVIYFFEVWREPCERLICVSLEFFPVNVIEESFRDVSYIGKLVDVTLELLKFIIFIEDNIKVVFAALISNQLINWLSLFRQLFKDQINSLHIFQHNLLYFVLGCYSCTLLHLPGFF